MNPLVQQLMSLGPGIVSGLKGNGPAMQAFLQSYHQTQLQLEQQERQKKIDALSMQDRQRSITRQDAQDQQAVEDRKRRQAIELPQVGQSLAESGAAAETPQGAESAIDALYRIMAPSLGGVEQLGGVRDAAINQATRTITARQKRQVGEFVAQALKTSYVADNPEADPVIDNLPEHIAKSLGKPSAKLSELQQFAQLPIGKPSKPPSAEVSLQSKEVMVGGKPVMANYNPKTGAYTDQSGKPVVADVIPPKPSATDPEMSDLRKQLLQLQIENAGKTKDPNQAQFTAGSYAGRMEQAEPILAKVAPAITRMGLTKFELQTNSWFAKPTFQSAEVQSYMQAARNFINSVLRRESGAVISPSEFTEAKAQYLPVPNDTPEALAQKAANRAYVMQQMKRAAGPAYEPPLAPPGGGSNPQFIVAKDQQGNIHHAPAGTPLPTGWTLVKQ